MPKLTLIRLAVTHFLSTKSRRLLAVAPFLIVVACAPQTPSPTPTLAPTLVPTPQTASSPAPPPSTPTPEPPSTGVVGDTLEGRQWRMTLQSVQRVGKTFEWPQPPGKADAAGEFVVAQLSIQHLGRRTASLSFQDFQLLSKGGDFFPATNCCNAYVASKGMRPLTFITEFDAGDVSLVLVIFDVPPTARDLTLTFTQEKGLFWQLD